jgi:hypothetical protein
MHSCPATVRNAVLFTTSRPKYVRIRINSSEWMMDGSESLLYIVLYGNMHVMHRPHQKSKSFWIFYAWKLGIQTRKHHVLALARTKWRASDEWHVPYYFSDPRAKGNILGPTSFFIAHLHCAHQQILTKNLVTIYLSISICIHISKVSI